MSPNADRNAWPELLELVRHVADLKGLGPVPEVVGDLAPGWGKAGVRSAHHRPVDPSGRPPIVLAGEASKLSGPDGTIARMGRRLRESPMVVVATDREEPVRAALADLELRVEFAGRTRIDPSDTARSGHVLVVDAELSRTHDGTAPAAPPDDFRVVAMVTVFNEEDVLPATLQKLSDAGIGFYVLDNWSTDASPDIARGFAGRGLVGFERFPDRPPEHFSLSSLLGRVADVAATLPAEWVIHHDADEVRLGPWPGVGLREALWRVDLAGYNAVDFTVVNYRPTDDGFVPGEDFERHLRHFEFGTSPDLLLQIKAWRNRSHVDLTTHAGHQALFAGRRVFPYKFLLKHYPIRSQAHGERKVLRERLTRFDPAERARGWHTHYDDAARHVRFVRDPSELSEDVGDIRTACLPEVIAGAGLSRPRIPPWARKNRMRRFVYDHTRRLVHTRAYGAVRKRLRRAG